ncbi:phosphopyruvate hydratase [Candidatus Wolfebacteria bacterium CG03_land_8_20_14_0_80_40_12]|uniref:Enolase n=1 Tax=Candidatus Wolfebacteria bacterium CG03_land_8_20_14_0_80_40_12 TaxID=1975069 RepID=A0A2M7B506_9BACT|nr:MAG: phosphopyruvate hydratase [Candidatus Wolfebacteria bacterium CG03_land_8_20_14_0_80_40_12]
MKISDANLKIILDSRGKETLEAELKTDEFSTSASVPSGKSKGTHEAFVLEPKKAIEKFKEVEPQILNREFQSQEEFDNFLIQLDGTSNKQNLGANLILALSLAFARLKAKSENLELFEYISKLQNLKPKTQNLKPIFNVINGGVHAAYPKSQLNFQEFQIIPETKDFGIALGLGQEFYRKLKEFLEKKFGKENVVLGDEAGFSCPFKNNEEAIEILAELIVKYNYPLRIGLDAAASQFYLKSENVYIVDGKEYGAEELLDLYLRLIEVYNILSIEDPFYEEDFDSFASLTTPTNTDFTQTISEKCQRKSVSGPCQSVLVITDDLTTTNPERLKTAINKKSGNAILIKPNQIGTLTQTLKVVQLAYENNWQAIVSHRSAETRDDFIADLAVSINAWGLKAGAPAAPERLVKYERILKINTMTK